MRNATYHLLSHWTHTRSLRCREPLSVSVPPAVLFENKNCSQINTSLRYYIVNTNHLKIDRRNNADWVECRGSTSCLLWRRLCLRVLQAGGDRVSRKKIFSPSAVIDFLARRGTKEKSSKAASDDRPISLRNFLWRESMGLTAVLDAVKCVSKPASK